MSSFRSGIERMVLWLSVLFVFFLLAISATAQVTFSDEIPISFLADHPYSVFSADLDGDGDKDILSASVWDDKIAWYENTDGLGSFGPQQVITFSANGAISVLSVDLDGDEDNDVIAASYTDNTIAWYENTDGLGGFGQQRIITTEAMGVTSIYSVDLDGDGDYDVLSSSWYYNINNISWYENIGGLGNFEEEQIISTEAFGANDVFSADLDGDGDYDVLSASYWDNMIAWYENTNGIGNFGPLQVISTNAIAAQTVFSADLDGDGDNDVLSSSADDDKIAWYENTNGLGSFGPEQAITVIADGASSVFCSDLDGDGDYDVLSASFIDDKIAWYENTDGLGSFAQQQIISENASGAIFVFSDDLDGDGDYDVLSASSEDSKIAWYRNEGAFEPGLFPFHLLSPVDGAQMDSTYVPFSWESTTENVEGVEISYNVYIAEDNPVDFEPIAEVPDTAFLFVGEPGIDYFWRIQAVSSSGSERWAEELDWNFTILENAVPYGAARDEIPSGFAITSVYPNPFNASTVVTVTLPGPSGLTVDVYDLNGRLVTILADGSFATGSHSFTFNAYGLPSGMYFVQGNVSGTRSALRKILLLK